MIMLAGIFSSPAKATNAVASVPESFTITGSGWGHGLGMSQYGAYGMALDGFTAEQIISHYYRGAKAELAETPTKLRVGLLQDKKFVALQGEKHPDKSAGGELTLWVDGVKQTNIVAANTPIIFETVLVGKGAETKASVSGKAIAQGSKLLISWSNTKSLINLSSGTSAKTALSGLGADSCTMNKCPHRYRYGNLEITSGSIGPRDGAIDLNVVNTLRLSDHYLYGLGEMPSSWPLEALKSQVIAARSFALIKSRSIQSYCDCNLDTTDGSQVFSGFSKEFSAFGDKWVQAVIETVGKSGSTAAERARSGLVIKNDKEIIAGYYSSSTGGKTQPRSEVWGTGTISWLVSVDDKWSQDPRVRNPNANWVDTISQEALLKNLKSKNFDIPDVAALEVSKRFDSGGVSELTLRDSAGNIYLVKVGPGKDISPDALRGMLDVKSTYISSIVPVSATTPGSVQAEVRSLESVARINWPSKSIKPSDYNFTGIVSPAQLGAKIKLQRKSGGKWKTISTTSTDDKGAWSILWSGPRAGKHDLRITASNSKGTIRTKSKRITMAGALGITTPKSAKRNSSFIVSGKVSPEHKGVKVILQRKIGNGPWRTVARLETDAEGKWSSRRYTGSTKSTVSYRVKTTDSRIGKLTSKVKATKVK
jgi:SpoIID/LytB domain protein